MKRNNIFTLSFLFFLVLSSFLIPKSDNSVSISNYVVFGYDSNVSKISDSEDIGFNNSSYVTYRPTLKAAVNIFKRKTRISISGKFNHYYDVPEKSNNGFYLSVNQSIGNYQSLKFYHAYIKDIYIRMYDDLDNLVTDELYLGSDCYFDLIKFKISYESPYIGEKDKIELSIYNELQYYSPEFTEYDLNILGFEGKVFTKQSHNRYSASVGYAKADSLYSHNHHLLSGDFEGNSLRLVDRSYEEVSMKFSYDMPLEHKKVLGFSLSKKQRKYLSNNDYIVGNNIIVDELHKYRKHRDFTFNVWYTFLNGNKKNKILLSYREKKTSSPFGWVEDLKSFSKFNLGYTVYFNKIKLDR